MDFSTFILIISLFFYHYFCKRIIYNYATHFVFILKVNILLIEIIKQLKLFKSRINNLII